MARVLAVDWGQRRVGLALSDELGMLASGLPTLQVTGRDDAVAQVAAVAREREAARIVVGLPLMLSGAKGEAAEQAEAFAAELGRAIDVPIELMDVRLTSALSTRRLHEAGVRGAKARARVDQGAAVALLESWLDRARARGA